MVTVTRKRRRPCVHATPPQKQTPTLHSRKAPEKRYLPSSNRGKVAQIPGRTTRCIKPQTFNRPGGGLSRANTFIYAYDFRRVKVAEETLQVYPSAVPTLAAAVTVAWMRSASSRAGMTTATSSGRGSPDMGPIRDPLPWAGPAVTA